MSKRNQITYRKPDPPFLRRIREKLGYQAGPDVNTKKEPLGQADEKELQDHHDEKPTVVFTEDSNLTREEQEDFAEKLKEVKPVKILFKKPVKKEETEQSNEPVKTEGLIKSTGSKIPSLKRPLDDRTKSDEEKPKKTKQKEKNTRLLSFDDEEDF